MGMSGKEYRVTSIELWRFLFCFSVWMMHWNIELHKEYFHAGYLGVEFFFILSGYGVASYFNRDMKGQKLQNKIYAIGRYIGKRIIRLYPLYLLSLVLILVAKTMTQKMSFSEVVYTIKHGYAEFILMQCGPLGEEVLLSPGWYVACVFWGGIILLGVLTIFDQIGGMIICPFLGVGIYYYFAKMIAKIDVIFSYYALLRGIAGMCIGVFMFYIITWLRKSKTVEKLQSKRALNWLIYMLATLILAFIWVYTNYGHRSLMDFVVIFGFFVAQIGLFCAKLPVREEKVQRVNRFFMLLGKTTYPIYLLHMPVILYAKLVFHF